MSSVEPSFYMVTSDCIYSVGPVYGGKCSLRQAIQDHYGSLALQSESVPKIFDRMTDSVGSDHTAS